MTNNAEKPQLTIPRVTSSAFCSDNLELMKTIESSPINKMTQNSIKTYNQTSELRQTNKMIVLKALQSEPNQSRFEIGRKTGLGDIESQRRLSDLVNEDKAIITGSRKHFKHDVSLYSAKQQLTLYQKEKPQKLAEWLKNNHPEILDEYKIYKQSFLF